MRIKSSEKLFLKYLKERCWINKVPTPQDTSLTKPVVVFGIPEKFKDRACIYWAINVFFGMW